MIVDVKAVRGSLSLQRHIPLNYECQVRAQQCRNRDRDQQRYNRKSEEFEVRPAGSTRLLSVNDSGKCEHHLFVDYYITSNQQPLFTRCNVTFPGRWCNPRWLIYILESPSGLVVRVL